MMGFSISGITDLLNLASVPIHVQNEEAELVDKVTGVGLDNLRTHSSGDKISVGSIEIELMHTPGHTPGINASLLKTDWSQETHSSLMAVEELTYLVETRDKCTKA